MISIRVAKWAVRCVVVVARPFLNLAWHSVYWLCTLLLVLSAVGYVLHWA